MELDDHIYSNCPSLSKCQDKSLRHNKRGVMRLVIPITVVLFLSLLTNAVLIYLYCKIELPPCTLPSQTKKCSVENRTTEYQINEKGTLYVFSEDELSWSASRNRCQELGGDLVIVNTQEEHEFLANMVSTVGHSALHWIGLTDAENEGVWLWVDQTPLKENLSWWAYPPDDWKAHDPLGEDCAVYYTGKWGDVSCSQSQKRICEIHCTSETS